MRLAIQLYTLRDLDRSTPELLETVAKRPHYEGVEFAGLDPEESAGAVASALDDTGLSVAGAHVDLEAVEDDPDGVAGAYHRAGCTEHVIPSYEHDAFESEAGASRAGDRLAVLEDRLPEGAQLHYHNHTFEFTPTEEGTTFDAFAGAADGIGLEIDTGLANHAGQDPVALLERYGDRVSLMHLTDSRPDDEDALHVDPGEGSVDIAACIETADDAGVEWVIFEHGLTEDPIASMEHAGETLAPLL